MLLFYFDLEHRMLNTEEGKFLSHALEESTQRGTKELKLEGSENKKKS